MNLLTLRHLTCKYKTPGKYARTSHAVQSNLCRIQANILIRDIIVYTNHNSGTVFLNLNS